MSASTPAGPAVIVWFRDDLRLGDNPALQAAVRTGRPIVPVFIDETDAPRPLGGAARWWLHGSLQSLGADLRAKGSALILLKGKAAELLPKLAGEIGAGAVHWTGRYHPDARALDATVARTLEAEGIAVSTFNATLLVEPQAVRTAGGGYFQVYTPFARAARDQIGATEAMIAAPTSISAPKSWPEGIPLDALKLCPEKPDWAGGLRDTWTPGEAAAHEALSEFVAERLTRYKDQRDIAAADATSRLSPYLRFGEISPHRIWAAVATAAEKASGTGLRPPVEKFQSELLWREFAHHLLSHLPPLERDNVQSKFDDFAWRHAEADLNPWKKGRTGYPIVDAGMRQLWQTGWLHNRVRMIVASFLTKDLLVDWRVGEAWFWDTLVDADHANNPAGWQWVAGSGADAAPYFRIFNPTLQAKKFDPDGSYVRTFVPEIARLPDAHIHEPWRAPATILDAAGITLGETYPEPIVDHAHARKQALAAFEKIKRGPAG